MIYIVQHIGISDLYPQIYPLNVKVIPLFMYVGLYRGVKEFQVKQMPGAGERGGGVCTYTHQSQFFKIYKKQDTTEQLPWPGVGRIKRQAGVAI